MCLFYSMNLPKCQTLDNPVPCQSPSPKFFCFVVPVPVLLSQIIQFVEPGFRRRKIGFSHKPSVTMVARRNESRLLKKDDPLPFLQG